MFSSTQGRWPSPDPAGLAAVDFTNPQSSNLYAYVLNEPLTMVDPEGLCTGTGLFDDESSCPDMGSGGSWGGGGGGGGGGWSLGAWYPPYITCTDPFSACTPGALNAGAQPNLPLLFNEGPGGYSYGGVNAFVALSCAWANNPADPGCWGVSVSLSGGTYQGSWSLNAYATDASKPLALCQQPTFGGFSYPTVCFATLVNPDPLNPILLQYNTNKPSPLPNPTKGSYVQPSPLRVRSF
jgi:hypothetical protein